MDLDKWIIDRTERVVADILELTGQPSSDVLWIMTEVIEENPGILRLLAMMPLEAPEDDFADVDDEVQICLEEFWLMEDEPLCDVKEVASKTLLTWSLEYFEALGVIHLASDSVDGLDGLTGFVIEIEDDPDETDAVG